MGKKSAKIAGLIQGFQGQGLDAHYLGFFECFNQGLFYEAHEVLEELWLANRQGPHDAFYKGLIQLAGAFVHLQKGRLRPSAALFKLARTQFQPYPTVYEHLNLGLVRELIEDWLTRLESGDFAVNPLLGTKTPTLRLKIPTSDANPAVRGAS